MHDFISTKSQIEKELLEIDSFLKSTPASEPSDIQAYGEEIVIIGNEIDVRLGRSGKLLSDAKYHLNSVMRTDILVTLIKQMEATCLSASAQKEFIKSACVYESWLVDMAGRINASLTHKLDWYRSLLSAYKEEKRLQQNR